MNRTNDTSALLSSVNTLYKHHVNWHEAVTCAIEIELRDYAKLLQFLTEYKLGKNYYRIDLLIVKKLSGQVIPKNIACIFKTYNLVECKGIHSSLTVNAYYKTIGYAGLLIDQLNNTHPEQYTSLDISLTFLTFHYPRKLINHLTEERQLIVEKTSEGIYHISIEIFDVQIIVTNKLPPEENLYLRCLTNNLTDTDLANRLVNDYARHCDRDIYIKYLNQLITANLKTEGGSLMVCEGLLNLFGTSSEEIIAKAKKESADYYQPRIDELSASIAQLSSQNNYLKELLKQHNISFE
ncbi:MAG: hypothetical protein HDR18_01875 [Lachnospiraceae bacterium]|nr:hypothetical protein [Lachnospiraceae bacterium]